ncbi:MAG: hypothetical protein IJM85_06035 [Clostridia bacterium]|nr:hypothetical protein [Clostridia bacterium]
MIKTYEIPYFIGLDQSIEEDRIRPAFSPDAVNCETEGGRLRTAKGYLKYSSAPVPGAAAVDMLTSLRKNDGSEIPVCITGGSVYALVNDSWQLKYSYEAPISHSYDCAAVRIGTTDHLVIADGKHRMLKFDGSTVSLFGSEEGCSDIPCAFLTVYRGRLFAAGESENPDRLYYSCLPGSGRTVENWGYVEASPAVEGGHAEVGSIGGDPIVAIKALSNQLLIFKKHSLYRLIGDRPSNFTIEHIDASVPETVHTAIGIHGDILYFVTKNGLYYYNGVTARPCPDMRLIKRCMSTANVKHSRLVTVRDRLYFTIKRGFADEMVIYDLIERKYMRRTGFSLHDLAEIDGMVMLISGTRHLCMFESGETYDGVPISAYWTTPLTDLSDMAVIKSPRMLFMRAHGDPIDVTLTCDGRSETRRITLPASGSAVTEMPFFEGGRAFSLRIANVNGGRMEFEGGLQLELSVRRRTE